MKKIVVMVMALFGCGHSFQKAKSVPDFPKVDVSKFDDQYADMVTRLKRDFIEQGYVVSRETDREPRHIGDAAKYTGLALAVVPCDVGDILFKTLSDSIGTNRGQIVRYAQDPNSSRGLTSGDQELGVTFGFVNYWYRCGKKQALVDTWKQHFDFIRANDYFVEPPNDDKMNIGYQWYFHKVSNRFLGVSERPPIDRGQFELNLLANAQAALSTKGPCYPVDLSMLQVISASKMGFRVDPYIKSKFCAITKDMGLIHADLYCHRTDGLDFLASYQTNDFEYRPQLCKWQDGKEPYGTRSHGVDWLLIYMLAKGELT